MSRTIAFAVVFSILAVGASAETLSGTVQDPGGAPFKGAFVQAQNLATKMTHSVLSDRPGAAIASPALRPEDTTFRSRPSDTRVIPAAA